MIPSGFRGCCQSIFKYIFLRELPIGKAMTIFQEAEYWGQCSKKKMKPWISEKKTFMFLAFCLLDWNFHRFKASNFLSLLKKKFPTMKFSLGTLKTASKISMIPKILSNTTPSFRPNIKYYLKILFIIQYNKDIHMY